MKTHFTPTYFANPQHPISITVIGCGGTGSHLLPKLASLNHALLQFGHPGLHVKCYDHDIVQEHNIGRQNFFYNDIGQYKAFQIISKINNAYGLDWEAYNMKFKASKSNVSSNIIITCVDTVNVRTDLAKIKLKNAKNIDYNTPFYWLDCGNGRDFGQVVLGTLRPISQPEKHENTTECLNNVVDVYGNLSQYDTIENQGIESCSFIESIQKQDLFINDEIAMNAAKIIKKMILSTTLNINGYIVNQSLGQSKAFPI